MALTRTSLVDLNSAELILDLDADTSIRANTDDTIDIKIAGSTEVKITNTALSPGASNGNALGTSALEWSDLFLADGAVISFGDDQDTTLTHTDGSGLTLNSTNKLMFNDASQFIQGVSATVLDIAATDEIELTSTLIDVVGNLAVSGTIVGAGALTAATSITVGSAVLTEAELETLDGITVGTAIASKVVTTDANIDTSGQRNLTITGELDAATGDFSGDVDIDGTANLDVVDIDGATQIDATVTVGVNDTGYDVKFFGATSGAFLLWDESADDLILAGDAGLQFRDSAISIRSDADGDLDINADDEIELNSTLIDVNGNLDVSGTIVSAGTITGTLATAAQTNVTSLGTLTALQIDNININTNTISSTAGTDLLITPVSGQQIVLDGAIVIDAGVVTGATSITSTAFVGNLTGNVTGTVATAAQNSITTATGLVTVGAAGTLSTIAGVKFFNESNSIYTHDVSATTSGANRNTAIGINALDAITTGDDNAAFGQNALTTNTTGSENAGIGMEALKANTTGARNVA